MTIPAPIKKQSTTRWMHEHVTKQHCIHFSTFYIHTRTYDIVECDSGTFPYFCFICWISFNKRNYTFTIVFYFEIENNWQNEVSSATSTQKEEANRRKRKRRQPPKKNTHAHKFNWKMDRMRTLCQLFYRHHCAQKWRNILCFCTRSQLTQ